MDLVVIGGGWGGYTAALTMAQHGGRVALVERDKVGGVCLHWGCIPTKALLDTAATLRQVRAAAQAGVRTTPAELDWDVAQQRKDATVTRLAEGMERALAQADVKRLAGTARLAGPAAVDVSGAAGTASRIEADAVVLATGSVSAALPFLPVDGTRVITSDHALRIPPPRRAAIVGAGAVGMEFASMWVDLGSEVLVLEALPSALPNEDVQAAAAVVKALTARGVRVVAGARIDPASVRIGDQGVRLEYDVNGARTPADVDVVLVAVGRRPSYDELNLGSAGVHVENGAIVVDAQRRTSAAGVYAVGDVTGGLQLAHVAAAEGRFVAEALLGDDAPPPDPVWMPRATYTAPQIASIGLTEAEARANGRAVVVGRAHWGVNARALIHGATEGLVKIVGDATTGDLLGAHIVGPDATELIGQVSLAHFLDASIWEIGHAVQPHPTLSEAVADAAQAALRPKRRLGTARENGEKSDHEQPALGRTRRLTRSAARTPKPRRKPRAC